MTLQTRPKMSILSQPVRRYLRAGHVKNCERFSGIVNRVFCWSNTSFQLDESPVVGGCYRKVAAAESRSSVTCPRPGFLYSRRVYE